jgi:hypothetical protein
MNTFKCGKLFCEKYNEVNMEKFYVLNDFLNMMADDCSIEKVEASEEMNNF